MYADLAQLVEQRIRNAEVEGSSPLIGTTRRNSIVVLRGHGKALI